MAKETIVKQVDVMGLMNALSTTGRAKLSDFATPIESEEPAPVEAEFRRRKEKSGGATLIIRQTHDYFWMLFEDAEEAATILPLAKEQLPCGGRLIPRIRFHHTKLDRYLPMLIRAGKRIAICEKITNNNNESNQEDKDMRLNLNANKNESANVQAAAPVNNSMAAPIEDAVAEEIKDVEVQEVQDIVPTAPTKKVDPKAEDKPAVTVPLSEHGTLTVGKPGLTPKSESKPAMPQRDKSGKFMPKAASEREQNGARTSYAEREQARPQGKAKAEPKPDPEAVGELAGMLTRVNLVVYKTKKGADAPMIVGFSGEDDERWKKLHDEKPKWVSAGYRKNDEGTKQFYLMFGSRYMAVAKALCEAYNTTDKAAWDKAEQACAGCYDGIVSGFKAEREARRAEKRAAGITPSPSPTGEGSKKTYTNEDVAAMLRKVLAGGNVPEDIERLLKAA